MTREKGGQGHSALWAGTKGPTRSWRTLSQMDDLEREYSPSSRVGGTSEPFVAGYQVRSAVVRAEMGDRLIDVGDGTLLVEAGPSAPLLVFIHGGYWQALSAEVSLFLAPGALANGWSFAAVEYTVAPAGTVASMAAECRGALARLASATAASSTVLVGHSAGAHLAAMVSIVQSPPLPLERTVLVSGVFDLRPLVHTSVNDPLGLDEEAAAALSPQQLPCVSRHEVVVVWGDNETDSFKAQSRAYATHLEAAGVRVSSFECATRHHFDIVDDLVDPDTPLGRATLGGPT